MSIFDQDNQPFDDANLALHIERALAIAAPDDRLDAVIYRIVQRLFKPTLVNTENVPEQPCLFIGNHALFAFDGAILAPTMLRQMGRFLRPLGDKFLWNSASEEFLLRRGAVIGHPDVCAALMDAGEDLLVFPGGAHEATKTEAERYTLLWKQRLGFVRMAAYHGYRIMPFAMVGPDEFYSHLVEGEDLPDTALGKLLTQLGVFNENTRPDMLPPVPLGALGSLFPKPQRCYIQFGEAVDLSAYRGKKLGKKQLHTLRQQVADDIEEMLGDLLRYRERHKREDGLLRRLLTV
ncbi:acyltransferase family protein [Halieaceae bacterium IMCC14734]|uniref:Acyltransferase family protein n=1 Tax=Candidatus Litorirhabdus singularis TaxID=2518993 RepID=A0ABT3TDQ4_9GAMM|nr:lysophospholipid acyltransferase family protein [Candidatus Litorirhabdus singularis]MCX2980403.1 acyltransferase family protein [Candidatus Litorirhabdus singularis]